MQLRLRNPQCRIRARRDERRTTRCGSRPSPRGVWRARRRTSCARCRGWITGRAFIDRATIHVHDPAAFAKEFPDGAGMALRLGYRSILAVPLLRENEAIGVITIRRSEAKPFAKTQIELVEAFAHQAVIAIENARLFEAEQRRTAELTEALEQKTATSEVLRVISSSPGDLKPVFDAMLGNAAHLCEAQFGILSLYEGGGSA